MLEALKFKRKPKSSIDPALLESDPRKRDFKESTEDISDLKYSILDNKIKSVPVRELTNIPGCPLWKDNTLRHEQIMFHTHLMDKLAHWNESTEFNRQFLTAGVGTGKTRIVLSVIVRMLLEGVADKGVFIFVNSTQSFIRDEFQTVIKQLQTPETGRSSIKYKFYANQCSETDMDDTESLESFIKDYKIRRQCINLFFVSGSLISYHAKKLSTDGALKRNSQRTILAIDECHTWMKRGNATYTLAESWKATFQIYISATMLPEGVDSIRHIANKITLRENDLFVGLATCNRDWIDTVTIPGNVEEKALSIRQAYIESFSKLRSTIKSTYPQGLSVKKRVYSCNKPVTLNIVYIQKAAEMNNVQKSLETYIFSNPFFLHYNELSSFITRHCIYEYFLFPPVKNDSTWLPRIKEITKERFGLDFEKLISSVVCNKTSIVLPSLLDKLVNTEQRKVLILSAYKERLVLIQKLLCLDNKESGLDGNVYAGNITLKQKEEVLRNFKTSTAKNVMFMTLNLALGLNIQEASAVIFLEPCWEFADVEQGIGRIARFGQSRDVHAYVLVYKDTVEDNVVDHCLKEQFFQRYFKHVDHNAEIVRIPVKGECKTFQRTSYVENVYNSVGKESVIGNLTSDRVLKVYQHTEVDEDS